MKKLTYLLFLVFLVSASSIQAQEPAPCGTQLGISPWLRGFQSRPSGSPRNDETLYIPLQIHVVGNDDGVGYMSKLTVMRSFCTLNNDFADANIQFFLANPINYIDNSTYYEHDFDGGYYMMTEHNFPNAVNCYIVQDPAGNCGYFFPGIDGIALNKSCTQPNDHTWAHEVGHFLSLPHPFFGWEGASLNPDQPAPAFIDGWLVEKLDGTNCNNAGDGFCDTPPDYLNYRWSCNVAGTSNVVQRDPNGEEFVSDGTLFMSYSNSGCKNRFSPDQIAAMQANIMEERPNLLTVAPAAGSLVIPETENITVLSPAAGVLIEGSSVRLAWAPVPNATHYLVQVNPFSIFSIVFNEFLVDEPELTFTNLLPDETFYWRIFPLNDYNTCGSFTRAASFDTGNVTASQELLAGEQLRVTPNPSGGGQVFLELESRYSGPAVWQVLNLQGQVLQTQPFNASNGSQRLPINTRQLPPGLYLLRVQLNDRMAVEKFIIH
jgi:hypothetical protein